MHLCIINPFTYKTQHQSHMFTTICGSTYLVGYNIQFQIQDQLDAVCWNLEAFSSSDFKVHSGGGF